MSDALSDAERRELVRLLVEGARKVIATRRALQQQMAEVDALEQQLSEAQAETASAPANSTSDAR